MTWTTPDEEMALAHETSGRPNNLSEKSRTDTQLTNTSIARRDSLVVTRGPKDDCTKKLENVLMKLEDASKKNQHFTKKKPPGLDKYYQKKVSEQMEKNQRNQ